MSAFSGVSTIVASTGDRASVRATLGTSETMAAVGEEAGTVSTPSLPPGTRIGRYELAEPLGSGGMGVVYRAYDPELERWLAIKVLRADRRDARDLSRFLREAQSMARLSHPNVVPVHDVGPFEGGMFLAMELVDGETLRQWLSARERPWRECVEMFVQAGHGLAEAHAAGIVHRDFKPENVLVDRRGRARVTDFGLARPEVEGTPSGSLRIGSSRLTRSGTILGTPAYMAPEQLTGREVEARADVFAFCVALYEALHGYTPFGGRTFAERLQAIEAGALRQPSRRLPRWLLRALTRGLAARREQRPDMVTLIAALSRGLSRRRSAWLAAGAAALASGAAALAIAQAEPARCEGAEEALAGVWDDAAREAVATALRRGGRAYAEDTWSKVQGVLDMYVETWASLQRQACEAHQRGEISDAMLDRRSVCLGQRKADLALLVAALRAADDATTERAVDAARSLEALAGCEDPEVEPEASPELVLWREQQRAGLTQARLLDVTHKHAEGLAAVEAVLTEAEARGEEALKVEALLVRARLQYGRGEYERARADALAALEGAHAHGRDRVATQAAAELALLDGEMRGRYEVGEAWARVGLAGARRIGDELEEAAVRHVYGLMLSSADRGEEALAELGKAHALRLRLLGADHRQTASTAMTLGNALWKRGRAEEALSFHASAVKSQEGALGPEHPGLIAPLANLGVSQEALGRVEEARASWERSLALIEANLGPTHPNAGALHANLGSLAGTVGDLDGARAHLEAALAVARAGLGAEHPDTALILGNLGNVLLERGELDVAETSLREALAITGRTVGAGHSNNAILEVSLARLCRARGRIEEARALLRSALATTEKTLGAQHPRIAEARFDLARLAADEGRHEEALAELEAARAIVAAEGPEVLRARVDLALARSLRALGRDPGRAAELTASARAVAAVAGPAGALLRTELAAAP